MKRVLLLVFILSIVLSCGVSAFAEESEEWKAKPTITGVYDVGKDQLLVTWEGKSVLYEVYLDGQKTATINLNNALIKAKTGRHQLQVVPVLFRSKDIDTSISLNYEAPEVEIPFLNKLFPSSLLPFGSIGLNLDLAALGLDAKDRQQGERSETFSFNLSDNALTNAVPEITAAATDFQNRVILSFTDKYNADCYRIQIKSGKDINTVEFDPTANASKSLVNKSNTSVTVVLDPVYLKQQGCLIPDLDQKYSFSVILEKYAVNLVDRAPEPSILHSSKESKAFTFTPYAAWKNAPEITYASQTADGQVLLQWDHDDGGLGCEYEITQHAKLLAIKKGAEVVGRTKARELLIKDRVNGTYYYTVTPVYSRESGSPSDEASVEVTNNWMAAPVLSLKSLGGNQVLLSWTGAEGVEQYHVTVSAGSGSLLRFVNLDFKKLTEFDVSAATGQMEYKYTYGNDILTVDGVKLRFDIYAVRHDANGTAQQSTSSRQTITIK